MLRRVPRDVAVTVRARALLNDVAFAVCVEPILLLGVWMDVACACSMGRAAHGQGSTCAAAHVQQHIQHIQHSAAQHSAAQEQHEHSRGRAAGRCKAVVRSCMLGADAEQTALRQHLEALGADASWVCASWAERAASLRMSGPATRICSLQDAYNAVSRSMQESWVERPAVLWLLGLQALPEAQLLCHTFW
jgi:hypothetical protein